jgi:hypothetical protein
MPKLRCLELDEPERKELERCRDHDPHPYLRERAAALLKIAQGQRPAQVARSGLLKPRDPDVIYGWMDRYQPEFIVSSLALAFGGIAPVSICTALTRFTRPNGIVSQPSGNGCKPVRDEKSCCTRMSATTIVSPPCRRRIAFRENSPWRGVGIARIP